MQILNLKGIVDVTLNTPEEEVLEIGFKRGFARFWSCDLDGAYHVSHFIRDPVFPEKKIDLHIWDGLEI